MLKGESEKSTMFESVIEVTFTSIWSDALSGVRHSW